MVRMGAKELYFGWKVVKAGIAWKRLEKEVIE